MVCGFDLLRCEGGERSLVIDVNGWSFVKGNQAYYDKAAEILSNVCTQARDRRAALARLKLQTPGGTVRLRGPSYFASKEQEAAKSSATTSTLKASVTVFRHSDRTPKMKSKVSASRLWPHPSAEGTDPIDILRSLASSPSTSTSPGVRPLSHSSGATARRLFFARASSSTSFWTRRPKRSRSAARPT
jgi:hypothetical protein